MARKNTPKHYKSAAERGLGPNEHYNAGNGRVFVDAGKVGKKYIGNRYQYRYQKTVYDKTGRSYDPSKEIVHHVTEPYDTGHFSREMDKHVAIESRKQHYKYGHGRPFARPGGRAPKPRGF